RRHPARFLDRERPELSQADDALLAVRCAISVDELALAGVYADAEARHLAVPYHRPVLAWRGALNRGFGESLLCPRHVLLTSRPWAVGRALGATQFLASGLERQNH